MAARNCPLCDAGCEHDAALGATEILASFRGTVPLLAQEGTFMPARQRAPAARCASVAPPSQARTSGGWTGEDQMH